MVVKYCVVPGCGNKSSNCSKIFLRVPDNIEARSAWNFAINSALEEMNADLIYFTNKKTHLFCCEDHFNLEEDIENWVQYKTIGRNMRIKEGVVPHRNLMTNETPSTFSQFSPESKKRKVETVDAFEKRIKTVFNETEEETRSAAVEDKGTCSVVFQQEASTSKIVSKPEEKIKNRSVGTNVNFLEWKKVDKWTQVHMREKSTQNVLNLESSLSTSTEDTSTSMFSADSLSSPVRLNYSKDVMEKTTVDKICKNPKFYLGLPNEEYGLMKLLEAKVESSLTNIMMTIKKIRLNDPYFRLGIDFGVSSTMVGKIISFTIPKLANVLQELIYWPDKYSIQMHLPVPFLARYKAVQSIIDCLEIEIQKPENAVIQSLTWSDYKKCNTAKFLISSTPSGLINFISAGYGGRTTDVNIVENCGYLDILPRNCAVMADRGFKSIESLLHRRNCKLIRPPSVQSDKKMTKFEVMESKRIAAVRIHIERVIRRLREFNILKPHSCVNTNLVPYLDYMIIIACGIINVQSMIIK